MKPRMRKCLDCQHAPDLAHLHRAGDLALARQGFIPCTLFPASYMSAHAHHLCPSFSATTPERAAAQEARLKGMAQ